MHGVRPRELDLSTCGHIMIQYQGNHLTLAEGGQAWAFKHGGAGAEFAITSVGANVFNLRHVESGFWLAASSIDTLTGQREAPGVEGQWEIRQFHNESQYEIFNVRYQRYLYRSEELLLASENRAVMHAGVTAAGRQRFTIEPADTPRVVRHRPDVVVAEVAVEKARAGGNSLQITAENARKLWVMFEILDIDNSRRLDTDDVAGVGERPKYLAMMHATGGVPTDGLDFEGYAGRCKHVRR
jgi:hypothetical protein